MSSFSPSDKHCDKSTSSERCLPIVACLSSGYILPRLLSGLPHKQAGRQHQTPPPPPKPFHFSLVTSAAAAKCQHPSRQAHPWLMYDTDTHRDISIRKVLSAPMGVPGCSQLADVSQHTHTMKVIEMPTDLSPLTDRTTECAADWAVGL